MVLIMSTFLSIEFIQALNPLYAFPIVAVILLAFIVYAFGFKSPAQPPSFDTIDEEKKSTKKRKTKETNKVKVVQNGKINGSNLNKNQVSVPSKKKEPEKFASTEKASTEKPVNEKKVTKKSKSSNEKKGSQEKKKDSFSVEDTGEGGWTQLISKKGRKNRKKDEATNVERQTCIVKPVQNLQNKSTDEIIVSEETLKADNVESSVPEKKLVLKDVVNEIVPEVENPKEKLLIIEDCKAVDQSVEKTCDENVVKNEKLNEENTTKSKKKKKKNNPEVNRSSNILTTSESSAEQVISEISAPFSSINDSPVVTETSSTLISKIDEQLSKDTKTADTTKTVDTTKIADTTKTADTTRTPDTIKAPDTNKTSETNKPSDTHKTSNVVFDELAGLYPEPKEQRKKKRVRRDH